MAQSRLAWPDIAKGISILGVVVLHVTLEVPGGKDTWIAQANHWLDPLRMPLFFLVSGFFSAKVLNYSFRQLWAKRLWFFLIPYLVWVPVELSLRQVVLINDFDAKPLSFGGYVEYILTGTTVIWFLYALIIFNIFLWCVRALPAWLAVVLSIVVPALLLPVHEEFHLVGKAILYMPIFVFATLFAGRVQRFSAVALKWWVLLITASLFVLGTVLTAQWQPYRDDVAVDSPLIGHVVIMGTDIDLFVRFVEHVLSLPLAITMVIAIAYIPVLSTILQNVGRRTLPIYLGHNLGIITALHVVRLYVVDFDLEAIALHGAFPLENTWLWIGYCFVAAMVAAGFVNAVGKTSLLGWTVYPPAVVALRPRV